MSSKDQQNLEKVLATIAKLDEPARTALGRMHEVILAAAPELKPRIWYGMRGYARSAASPVLIFIRKDELMVLGISERAGRVPGGEHEGRLRPSAWWFDFVDEATECRVAEIVRAAVARRWANSQPSSVGAAPGLTWSSDEGRGLRGTQVAGTEGDRDRGALDAARARDGAGGGS